MSQSVRVGCCEKFCYSCGTISIQLINLVDFLAGCTFVVFAIYLYENLDYEDVGNEGAWMGWCCGILGGLLLIESFFSFCAIVHKGCRCCMWWSCWLALLLAALNLGAGVMALALQKKFYHFLDDHGNAEGITDSGILIIKNWYTVIASVMLGLCILEIVRFQLSRGFKESSRRIDGEFDSLLMQDDENWQERLRDNTSARTEKYNDLRSHYKAKYANYSSSKNSGDSAYDYL